MKTIRFGSSGNEVVRWQYFLKGQEFYFDFITGVFDAQTHEATIKFQIKHALLPDGIVGNKTMGQAMLLGFGILKEDLPDKASDSFPPKPLFRPLTNNQQRQAIFGHLEYVGDPKPSNPEHIQITNHWDEENIITIEIKQLKAVSRFTSVQFHKKAARQLQQLFEDWEQHDLIRHIKSWDGAYLPRFVRGSKSTLSNHAFGTAFDINCEWNRLGIIPARFGEKGSVRELVELANKYGFYWGGHFSRRDGMHFEVAKLL